MICSCVEFMNMRQNDCLSYDRCITTVNVIKLGLDKSSYVYIYIYIQIYVYIIIIYIILNTTTGVQLSRVIIRNSTNGVTKERQLISNFGMAPESGSTMSTMIDLLWSNCKFDEGKTDNNLIYEAKCWKLNVED